MTTAGLLLDVYFSLVHSSGCVVQEDCLSQSMVLLFQLLPSLGLTYFQPTMR
jgi:hypothetical protein